MPHLLLIVKGALLVDVHVLGEIVLKDAHQDDREERGEEQHEDERVNYA